MKRPLPLLLAAAVLGQLANAQTNTPAEPQIPAVIVIRHGDDLTTSWPTKREEKDVTNWIDTWATNWTNYTLPNGKNVQVHAHGLSALGEKQAAWLATNLPTLLKEENFLPITRVVTKDPWTTNEQGRDPTPNPFDTAWPLIKTLGIQDVILVPAKKGINPYGPRAGKTNETVDKDLLAMLPCYHGSTNDAKPSDSILPTDSTGQPIGSTLIVWDGQGMWGPHEGKVWYWADDTEQKTKTDTQVKVVGANILRLLGGKVIGDEILRRPYEEGGGKADKARRAYLFYPRYGTGQFWAGKSATAIHIAQYGNNVPEYDLMVWDTPTNNIGQPTGWENVVNFSVDEEHSVESISFPPVGP
jgi:hypothetical protein